MAVETKHTPGPLEVRSLEGVWSVFEAETLALTASCPDGTASRPSRIREITADEALANARLYAAAPDLLDALKDVTPDTEDWWCPTCQEALSPGRVTHADRCDTCGTYLGDIATPAWLTKARAAIAKATGDAS